MRIISQDETVDVPYNSVCISLRDGGTRHSVICREIGKDETVILGIYSIKEKAIKAMKMLREAYAQNTELELSDKQKEDLIKFGAFWLEPMQDVKSQTVKNYYFQFPKDEEIEV